MNALCQDYAKEKNNLVQKINNLTEQLAVVHHDSREDILREMKDEFNHPSSSISSPTKVIIINFK